MSQPGWLNDNEFRSYPLVDREDLGIEFPPEAVIVDFGCLLGPEVDFTADDYVWLVEIRRVDADTFEFEFGCSVLSERLTFEVPVAAGEFTIYSAESAAGENACDEPPLWEGYLQVGRLSKLNLEISEALTFETGVRIEPSRIQTLHGTFLRSVSLGNEDRVRATLPDDCVEESLSLDDSPPIFVDSQCLSGSLRFMEGYNCAIRTNTTENSLLFSASVGAGAGAPCEEIPISDDEESLSSLLTGGPACNDRITSLNGVTARYIQLLSARGVSISVAEDNPSKLIIDFGLSDLDYCQEVEQFSLGGE
jgi:hypothetical protein